MGKNLKGKECGKGIYQRKDGLYSVRYYAKNGKRKEKYFETLPEAKNWLADARYEERHNLIVTSPDMTVDKWFEYWIENIVCDLAPNTKRNYQERYKWNIQPVIGAMCIADVKPMHCKAVLNRMETTYAGSTIWQAYITMGTMLKSAVMNDIIAKHPMNGVRYTKPVRAVDDIKYLTVDILHYGVFALDISVPCTERIVYIVLRERTQQIMKPLIGSLKNLLMQAAAKLWHIRERPDKLHIL